MKMNLSSLLTEQRNERTKNIDQLSTKEILIKMNEEDKKVAEAVQHALPQIENSIELIYQALFRGGRLFFIGAGTSGRLGVVDAAECPPTFRTDPDKIVGIIAGGKNAMFIAVEGVEDDPTAGAMDLEKANFSKADVVVGIAASGRTPYVIGALKYANEIGSTTIGLSCNKDSEITRVADCTIEVIVGPEVLTGSTRLKAATAHKMVLNMITTTTMIKLGKVYENLMVDVNASNYKLRERARSIVSTITGVTYEKADEVLTDAEEDVKVAIVMIEAKVPLNKSRKLLADAEGFVRKAIALSNE